MRIDYCPKCNKAGLKYHSNWDDPKYYAYHIEDGHCVNEIERLGPPEGFDKWCPRCKEWVKSINRPYIGSRGIA